MKKLISLIVLLTTAFLIGLAASYRPTLAPTHPAKSSCVGFTVIEAGKGLNCNGDTVKLLKQNGFYHLQADASAH